MDPRTEPAAAEDVARFERGLWRRGRPTLELGGDPSLTELLVAIDSRRARRAGGRPIPAAAPTPTSSTSAGPGRIASITEHGPSVRIFRIGKPAGFTFRPGQHVKLGVPGGKQDDFSIASAPHEPELAFAVELRPGGRVTPTLFALGVGDAVDVSAAKGKFGLAAGAEHHLMVATVTGVAPLRSMVLDALHRGGASRFTLLVGASFARELPFHDELEALAAAEPRFTYQPTVSQPDPGWAGARGRVDPLAEQVAASLDPGSTHVYAVGHRGMIANVRSALGGSGFEISTESYGG